MAQTERLVLQTLNPGDSFSVTAGEAPEAYTYDFLVRESGEMPLCEIRQTGPDGEQIGPGLAIVKGSGRMTTDRENPMQRADWFVGRRHQPLALSIGYGILTTGDEVVICDPQDSRGDVLCLQPTATVIEVNG